MSAAPVLGTPEDRPVVPTALPQRSLGAAGLGTTALPRTPAGAASAPVRVPTEGTGPDAQNDGKEPSRWQRLFR